MNTKPFEIIKHSKNILGKPIVDICGMIFSHEDGIKLRDELDRLFSCDTEPAPKAAIHETSAPNSLTTDPACPHCHGTGVGAGGVFTNCICTYGESTQPPIMDEDDLRRDLQRLCQEQQETIATLKGENDAWRADSQSLSRIHNLLCESMPGFKGCPSPPDWCFAALQELLEQRMLLNGNLDDMTKRYEHLERLYFQVTGKNDSPATNGTIKAAKQIMARVDATTLREA